VLAALLAVGVVQAQEVRLVDVGGHRLEMRLTGKGRPVVVIMTGAGDRYNTWNTIADSIAKSTTVIQYDRAGYGNSEKGPLPRSVSQEIAELHTLVKAAKVKGPYVLVGHSLGTFHALEYARRYPKRVAGVVVIDSPPETWLRGKVFPELLEMFKEAPAQMRSGAEQARQGGDLKTADFLEAVASEHELLLSEDALEARSGRGLGKIPLVAIAAGVVNPQFGEEAEAYHEYWVSQTRELAERVENGRFIFASESRHHVHLDDPGLVIGAIRELVK
jgi:pimeloyl-ACP methyl ester carboxylesterase